MICEKCNLELKQREVRLSYLGNNVTQPLPCCPRCGMVYIDETLVEGKLKQLEISLEDK